MYEPGMRGYSSFIRLPELFGEMKTGRWSDKKAAIKALFRRLRPSARLRQSEIERQFYQDKYNNG